MVDYIILENGKVIGISDECIALFVSEQAANDGIHIDNTPIYFSDFEEE